MTITLKIKDRPFVKQGICEVLATQCNIPNAELVTCLEICQGSVDLLIVCLQIFLETGISLMTVCRRMVGVTTPLTLVPVKDFLHAFPEAELDYETKRLLFKAVYP